MFGWLERGPQSGESDSDAIESLSSDAEVIQLEGAELIAFTESWRKWIERPWTWIKVDT